MSDTKHKNDTPRPIKPLPFIALWFLIGFISRVISSAFMGSDPTSYLTLHQFMIVVFLLGMPFSALLQVQLIERVYKRSMRGWLIYTLIGTLISLLIVTRSWYMSREMITLFSQLSGFVPVMLLQTVWLWRRGKKAWLWPLSISLSMATFYQFFSTPGSENTPLAILLSIFFGLLSGFALRHVLTHPRDTEKAKVDHAADEQAHQARLARLQESDEHAAPWLESNHQAQQKML